MEAQRDAEKLPRQTAPPAGGIPAPVAENYFTGGSEQTETGDDGTLLTVHCEKRVDHNKTFFQYILEAGITPFILVEFSHQGVMHSLMLSAAGAITLYSNYDENYALGLVERFNDLAIKFQTELEPKKKKGSEKTK